MEPDNTADDPAHFADRADRLLVPGSGPLTKTWSDSALHGSELLLLKWKDHLYRLKQCPQGAPSASCTASWCIG